MSESSRETKERRLAKNLFKLKGLEWSDDASLRRQAWLSALLAIKEAELVDRETLEELAQLGALIASGQWLVAIHPTIQILKTRREIQEVFGDAWNHVIIHGAPPEPEEEAPRHQVDFGTVGSKLPPQTIAMMGTKKTEVPAWLLPALGIGGLIYVWRK